MNGREMFCKWMKENKNKIEIESLLLCNEVKRDDVDFEWILDTCT